MTAEGGSGSSSRERTTSGERADNERRTISKFPTSIDLRQAFFFVLPNILTAFLSPPLVTFYLPRSSRGGESRSPSRPTFRPSIFPAPRLAAQQISQPLDSPPLDFSSHSQPPPDFPPLKFPSPSASPSPSTRRPPTFRPSTSPAADSSHTADLPQPLDSPPDFTQPKRFVFSHKRRARPHKPPPSSRTALGGGEGLSRQLPPDFGRRF